MKSHSPHLPPPVALINTCIFKQAPGKHPGQIHTNDSEKLWHLEDGKEIVELVTIGRGWIRTKNNQWEEVTPGALVWNVPGDQTIARSDWENPYQCLAVAFDSPQAKGKRRAPRLSWWKDLESVRRFAREAEQCFLDEHFNRNILFQYLYGRLLFQAQIYQRLQQHSELPDKLQNAIEWINKKRTEKILLKEVADHMGWSVAHLHEIFRKHLEITPHQFLVSSRIRLAKERLAGEEVPIKQIAAECGFSTVAAFCHTFKAQVGVTPSVYRKQHQNWIHLQKSS